MPKFVDKNGVALSDKQVQELDIASQRTNAGGTGAATYDASGKLMNAGDVNNLKYAADRYGYSYTPPALNIPGVSNQNNISQGSEDITANANNLGTKINNLNTQNSSTAETKTAEEIALDNAKKAEEDALAAYQSGVYSADEQAAIDSAGASAGEKYDPLIKKAQSDKQQGMGKAVVGAGERGGFMNTQYAGKAALIPTESNNFVGTGGVLNQIKSEYDDQIAILETARLRAISDAKSAYQSYLKTGKKEAFDMASKMYDQAQEAYKNKVDSLNEKAKAIATAAKDAQNYQMDVAKYNLDLNKYISGETRADTKDKLDALKLNIDIAGLTGEWNGAPTLMMKKQVAEEAFRKLGYDLDVNKFNEMVRDNSFKNTLDGMKYELDKSKVAAEQSGDDVQAIADQVMAGTINMDDALKNLKNKGSNRALLQVVGNYNQVLKTEYSNTKNLKYLLLSTANNKENLTDSVQTKLSKAFTVVDQLDNIKQVFNRLAERSKVGAFTGKITGLEFWDKDKAVFDAAMSGLVPNVARGIFGEVGVLTDNDINTYKKAIARYDNPKDAANEIFNMLYSNVINTVKNDLSTAANNKKNVSGFANTYETMEDRVNATLGIGATKKSTNPILYESVDDYVSSLGNNADAFYSKASADMKSAGITDVNDYFDFLKETAKDANLYKGVQFNNSTEPPFNNDLGTSQNYSGKTGKEYLKNYGTVTSDDNGSPYWKWGLDVDLKKGDPVYSPIEGEVVFSGKSGGFGNRVGVKTSKGNIIYLSHLDALGIKVGDKVSQGQLVGKGGNTGNTIAMNGGDGSHLDITIKKPDGSYYKPTEVQKLLS